MSKFWQQMTALWSRLEVAQKATIVLVLLGGVILAVVLGLGATRPDYRLLAGGLSKSQVSEIAAFLGQAHIPYQLADGETAILVPSKDLHAARNQLAQQDKLGDGSKGFEILGKSGMFTSSLQEHRTWDRAVAGELERSYKELAGVRSARVLIDRPQPSPFVGQEEAQPRAAIKLDMAPGSRLSDRQLQGVIKLAVGAVSGLAPERVQVMDNGGLLTRDQADRGASMASTALEAEMAREAYLTRKAQEQLDRVLGPGRSEVRVSVKLDFTRRTETLADPTIKVASQEQTRTSDEKTPVASAGGMAGTASNVEGNAQRSGQGPAMGSRTTEDVSTSYVVGKKTVTTEDEIGRIRGMNVSILIDEEEVRTEEKGADGKPTGTVKTERRPYSDADRKRFEELVHNAIGFNSARDVAGKAEKADVTARFTSSVQSMRFWREEPVVAAAGVLGSGIEQDVLGRWIGWALAAAVGIGLLVVARGQMARSHRAWSEAAERERAAAEEERRRTAPPEPVLPPEKDEEDEMARALRKRRTELRDSIKKRILEDPAGAAQIVKQWMYE